MVVGVFGLEALVEFAACSDVEISHKQLLSRAPAVALVAIQHLLARSLGEACGVQAVGGGEAGAQLGAILAPKLAPLRDGVKHLRTGAGFPRDDCGVGVEGRRQIVRVLLGDGRDVVDRQVKQPQIAVRPEAHVVHHFGGEQHPQAFFAVAQGGQEGLAVPVRVAVVGAGVVDFASVFRAGDPPFAHGIHAVRPRPNVLGHRQHQAVHVEGSAWLELAHETRTQRHLRRFVRPSWDQGVQVGFGVHGSHHTWSIDQPVAEVKTLLAVNEFEPKPVLGGEHEAESVQGVVDAQVALLVGTQHKPASELVVEVANRDVDASVTVGVTGKAVSHAAPVETPRKTEHGIQVALVPKSGAEVSLVVEHVRKGVVPRLGWRNHGADERVLCVGLPKDADVAGHLGWRLVLGHHGPAGHHGQPQPGPAGDDAQLHSASFSNSSCSSYSSPSA